MELQKLYNNSQQEREALEQELQRCKAELHKLAARKSQVRENPSCRVDFSCSTMCFNTLLVKSEHCRLFLDTHLEGFRVQTTDRKYKLVADWDCTDVR